MEISNSMFSGHNDIDTPRPPETEPNKQTQTTSTNADQQGGGQTQALIVIFAQTIVIRCLNSIENNNQFLIVI